MTDIATETMTHTATKTMTDTDRIEKRVVLRAPRSRVWRAIADSREFGEWFRCTFNDKFTAGKTVRGSISHGGRDHVIELMIDRIDPEKYFSYRWHPYAVQPDVDYSKEPTTLVEFRLDDAAEGTALTITESGFDRIPEARRAEAFRMDDQGWTAQVRNIERYVSA